MLVAHERIVAGLKVVRIHREGWGGSVHMSWNRNDRTHDENGDQHRSSHAGAPSSDEAGDGGADVVRSGAPELDE